MYMDNVRRVHHAKKNEFTSKENTVEGKKNRSELIKNQERANALSVALAMCVDEYWYNIWGG